MSTSFALMAFSMTTPAVFLSYLPIQTRRNGHNTTQRIFQTCLFLCLTSSIYVVKKPGFIATHNQIFQSGLHLCHFSFHLCLLLSVYISILHSSYVVEIIPNSLKMVDFMGFSCVIPKTSISYST